MDPYNISYRMRLVLVIGLLAGAILGWCTANIVWFCGGYHVVH